MADKVPFPKLEESFKDDDRVSFDTAKDVYILEDKDGKEYEWNAKYSSWIEMMDEALVQTQQSVYGVAAEKDDGAKSSKKRKADEKTTAGSKKAKKEPTQRVNSSIYVTGIPEDATFDDIHALFKKYGLIANNIDSEKPKIKMYAKDDGSFKGEALITYFRPESVQQAIYLVDGTDFRNGTSGGLHVEEADMSYKKHKEYQADGAPGKQRGRKDVEKIKRMTNKMNARLADWDDDGPQAPEVEAKPTNKYSKTVIVKNVFTLEELEKDPKEVSNLSDEIYYQAEKEEWGHITNVTVFDMEPEGVIRIKFKEAAEAEKAAKLMNGRTLDDRKLVAYVPEKWESYKKKFVNDDDEEEERLRKYGEDISKDE